MRVKSELINIENIGINLYSTEIFSNEIDIDKKNKILKDSLTKIKNLEELKKEIENDINYNSDESYEVEQLQKQLHNLEEQFNETDDEDEEFRLHREIKQIKRKIKNHRSSFFDKRIYKDLLSKYEELKNRPDNEKKKYLKELLQKNLNIKDILLEEIDNIIGRY